jgi:PKD repeat protein
VPTPRPTPVPTPALPIIESYTATPVTFPLGGGTVTFSGSYLNADSWTITFGDMTSQTGSGPGPFSNIQHPYTANGTYNAQLIVYNGTRPSTPETKTITVNP